MCCQWRRSLWKLTKIRGSGWRLESIKATLQRWSTASCHFCCCGHSVEPKLWSFCPAAFWQFGNLWYEQHCSFFPVFSGGWCGSCTTTCSNQANSKNWPPSIGCKACMWTIFYSSPNMVKWMLYCSAFGSFSSWVFCTLWFLLWWSKSRYRREFGFLVLCWLITSHCVKEVLDGPLNLTCDLHTGVWCFSLLLNCWDKLILLLCVPSMKEALNPKPLKP